MPLKLSVEYDHALGDFECTLENGAKFRFRREDVGGKLENNLQLYRRAVINLLEDKEEVKRSSKDDTRKEIMRLSAGRHVQVVGKRPKVGKMSLEDLDIDI